MVRKRQATKKSPEYVFPEGLNAFWLQLRQSSLKCNQYSRSSFLGSLRNHFSQCMYYLVKAQSMKQLTEEFFKRDTVKTARELLGNIINYGGTSGMIVETEAYKGYPDEASHAAKKTPRSAIMFDTYGSFYIYFVYGNHYCLNITTEDGNPGAVLIRALKPVCGMELMAKRRGIRLENGKNLINLSNGPGKLCQAMNITGALNGSRVGGKIKVFDCDKKFCIVETTRIGIKKATRLKWRFYIKDNIFVSKK